MGGENNNNNIAHSTLKLLLLTNNHTWFGKHAEADKIVYMTYLITFVLLFEKRFFLFIKFSF